MTFSNRQIISNSIWMMSEKIIYLFGLVFVTAFVARYIGPENFGKLAFVTSIFTIVQTICMFGLDNVIFQKISKSRKMGRKVMLASYSIRNILFFIISPILLIYLYFTADYLTFIFSISTCIATYFTLNDTIYSIYFNATLNSKVNMVCNSLGLLISLSCRYVVPYFNLEYYWLSISIISIAFIPFILRKIVYARTEGVGISYYYSLKKHRQYLFSIGKKLVLYSLSITLYTQVVQLFLGNYSKHDLGIFSVASTLGNSFYFVLAALISSFMIKIYSEDSSDRSQELVAKLNWIVISISFFAFLFLYIYGEVIIVSLYGDEYIQSAELLSFMAISCCFSGMATITEKYLFKFKAYDYLNRKTIFLCFLNFISSAVFISGFGVYGAVITVLLLQIISATLYHYVFKFGSDFNIIVDSHIKMFKLLKGFYR